MTLCGSVRFAEEHLRVHRALSLQGNPGGDVGKPVTYEHLVRS